MGMERRARNWFLLASPESERSYWHILAMQRSRFFAHHPRTCPKELALFGAPETFGAPFVQDDTALFSY